MANFKICLYLALCGIALKSSNANDINSIECFENGVAYPGNDLGPVKMKTAKSAQECQVLCLKTYGCMAFTFRASNEGCWLKTTKSEAETCQETAGCVSGNVICKEICQFVDGVVTGAGYSRETKYPITGYATSEQVCAKMVLQQYRTARAASFLNHRNGQNEDGTETKNECWAHFRTNVNGNYDETLDLSYCLFNFWGDDGITGY